MTLVKINDDIYINSDSITMLSYNEANNSTVVHMGNTQYILNDTNIDEAKSKLNL